MVGDFDYEKKWMDEYNLSLNECMILSSSKEIAKYFEEVVSLDVSLLGCQFAKKNFPGKCKNQK